MKILFLSQGDGASELGFSGTPAGLYRFLVKEIGDIDERASL
jgi:hypothetical protein